MSTWEIMSFLEFSSLFLDQLLFPRRSISHPIHPKHTESLSRQTTVTQMLNMFGYFHSGITQSLFFKFLRWLKLFSAVERLANEFVKILALLKYSLDVTLTPYNDLLLKCMTTDFPFQFVQLQWDKLVVCPCKAQLDLRKLMVVLLWLHCCILVLLLRVFSRMKGTLANKALLWQCTPFLGFDAVQLPHMLVYA